MRLRGGWRGRRGWREARARPHDTPAWPRHPARVAAAVCWMQDTGYACNARGRHCGDGLRGGGGGSAQYSIDKSPRPCALNQAHAARAPTSLPPPLPGPFTFLSPHPHTASTWTTNNNGDGAAAGRWADAQVPGGGSRARPTRDQPRPTCSGYNLVVQPKAHPPAAHTRRKHLSTNLHAPEVYSSVLSRRWLATCHSTVCRAVCQVHSHFYLCSFQT